MKLLSAVYRKLYFLVYHLKSNLRILNLRLLYPGISIDKNCFIGKNCYIRCIKNSSLTIIKTTIHSGSVIVADQGGVLDIRNSFIGGNSWIIARKKISITDSLIGEMVSIRDNNHNYNSLSKSILDQGFTLNPVIIKSNVWLGSKVTVLAGTTIEKNTVVGANAVVKGLLKENSVYVGVPAKKVR